MTRTDRQQLVRDAAWRLNTPERLARLTPENIGALGMAINGILGWGRPGAWVGDAQALRALIAKMDGVAN
jgi:hypothetical protein